MEDQEEVYDAQIAPLMTQIIGICKEHGIPMVATFQLNDGPSEDSEEAEEGEGPLFCTTLIQLEGCHEKIKKVGKVLYDGWEVTPPFMAFTVRQGSA